MDKSKAVKKRKVDAVLTTEKYVHHLKNTMQAIGNNCTVCMVNDQSNIGEHDHMANFCPHLNFYTFLKWKKNIRYNSRDHGPICICYHLP